jgi:hypothetical protein
MSYYILPKNNNIINVNPTDSETEFCLPYISYSLLNYFSENKEHIINICIDDMDLSYKNCEEFYEEIYEEITKFVNPYEYIFSKVPGSKFSVSKLKPNTNIFYDFLEISTTLNIFETFKYKEIVSLHITANHNDSIECFEMLRENFADEIICYDKIDDNVLKCLKDIKFHFLFFETNNNDGLNKYISSFIEIIMIILRHQNSEGVSIIKINHTFYKPIIDLLYLLTSLFDKVYIIKPNTNNITSFDKYVVCKNFLTDDTKITQFKMNYYRLLIFLKKLENKNILSIINYDTPYYFNTKMDDINVIIGQQQLESLDKIISILKNKNKDEKIETIKKTNIQKSVNWCEKYKIPYNKFTEKTNIFLPIIKPQDI